MGDFFENLPEIIKAAASSPLGIIALGLLVMAFITFFFFRKSGDKIKLIALLVVFVSVVLSAFAVIGGKQKVDDEQARQAEVVKVEPDKALELKREKKDEPKATANYPYDISPGPDTTAANITYSVLRATVQDHSSQQFKLAVTVR